MAKEIERPGIPVAYVTTLTSLAEEIRANRIVAGVRIPHPGGQSHARGGEGARSADRGHTSRARSADRIGGGSGVFRVDHRGPLMAPDPMRLVRQVHRVDSIAFGSGTALDNRRLSVDRQALVDLVLSDDRLTHCNVELVSLGENARIVHICNTVEPQWRVGPTFPAGSQRPARRRRRHAPSRWRGCHHLL